MALSLLLPRALLKDCRTSRLLVYQETLAGDVPRLRPIDVVQYGWNMIDRRMQVQIFDIERSKRYAAR